MTSRIAPVCVVEAAASLNAEVLGHRDLHALDVGSIPEGLEDGIREAREQHVVNGALSEVMVDSENVALHERTEQDPIQVARRSQVFAEWFLDDNAGPLCATRLRQLFHDRSEERRRNRQVVCRVLLRLRARVGASERSPGPYSPRRRTEAVRTVWRTPHGPGLRTSRRFPAPARATGRASSPPWPRR